MCFPWHSEDLLEAKKWSLLVKKLTIQDLKRGETEGMEGGTSMWSTASLGEAVSGNVTD